MIGIEGRSDEDAKFLLGLNGFFTSETEIAPTWPVLRVQLHRSTKVFQVLWQFVHRVGTDANGNGGDEHVLRIFVDHFQCETGRANIGDEHARRGETRLHLSDVVHVEQISISVFAIDQHLTRLEEIRQKLPHLTVPLCLRHVCVAAAVQGHPRLATFARLTFVLIIGLVVRLGG